MRALSKRVCSENVKIVYLKSDTKKKKTWASSLPDIKMFSIKVNVILVEENVHEWKWNIHTVYSTLFKHRRQNTKQYRIQM